MNPRDFRDPDTPLTVYGCAVLLAAVIWVVANAVTAFVWLWMYRWLILGR